MRERKINYGGQAQSGDSEKYFTIQDLSELLHMQEGTIRNRLWRGDPMPPSVRIGRRRLFRSDLFYEWMTEFGRI